MANTSERLDDNKNELVKAVEKSPQTDKKNKEPRKKKKEKDKDSGIINYFRGVKLEMKKVVWPTRKELGSYTVVVICTCAAFALLFWGIDSGVLAAIQAICF